MSHKTFIDYVSSVGFANEEQTWRCSREYPIEKIEQALLALRLSNESISRDARKSFVKTGIEILEETLEDLKK